MPTGNRTAPGLIRGLGLWSAIAVIVGSMIGQGVFLVASDMARELGSPTRVLAVWIIGGIVVLLGAFCYAELGAALPEAGGDYIYLIRGFSPGWGFLYGWTSSVIMRPGMAAVVAAGLLRFTGFLLPSVTNPIFTWHLTLSFLSQPYQFTFTVAQPVAAGGHRAGHSHQLPRSPHGGSFPGISDIIESWSRGCNRDPWDNAGQAERNSSLTHYIACSR